MKESFTCEEIKNAKGVFIGGHPMLLVKEDEDYFYCMPQLQSNIIALSKQTFTIEE